MGECQPTGLYGGHANSEDVVYVTRGLLEVCLRMAADAEPESISLELAVTPAGELSKTRTPGDGAVDIDDLSEETPVFTHFYMPEAGQSITAVFGMNLSTPPGRTQGRFLSHPLGELAISRTDDLHGVVIVAVPPWDESSVAAFDRAGRRVELTVLDVVPPSEDLEPHSR